MACSGGFKYKPTMGFQFFGKADIPAEFEGPDQMRLEAVGVPDAPHAGLTDAPPQTPWCACSSA